MAGFHQVALASLELVILLPLPPKGCLKAQREPRISKVTQEVIPGRALRSQVSDCPSLACAFCLVSSELLWESQWRRQTLRSTTSVYAILLRVQGRENAGE